MALKHFIPKDRQHLIIEAIQRAEQKTSGEIVVHVTQRCKGDAYAEAEKVFNSKKLYETIHHNAALIFIAYKDRKLAVIGDSGIYEKAPRTLWDEAIAVLCSSIKAGNPVEGIVEAVDSIGENLAVYFPADNTDNPNEISDEISYAD